MMKAPKPPRIPRCLCSSWLHFFLGIASPSCFLSQRMFPTDAKAVAYFNALGKYKMAMTEYRIANRTCARAEWYGYYRQKRRAKRQEVC